MLLSFGCSLLNQFPTKPAYPDHQTADGKTKADQKNEGQYGEHIQTGVKGIGKACHRVRLPDHKR